ncbi:DUF2063 domain-containing protein [Thermomonas sp.]|uniref:HvfC/BufC N-terminal domain-containing protein n=1 Tax=Thermomonas sp. TaxID=1971895 RepID=UPI0035AEB7FF
MNALVTTQTAMLGWLLHGDSDIAACVDGDAVPHRLRIYADAYRLRLLEVLGNDFPVSKSVLGDAAFDETALDYLRAHPSTRPSARYVGHAFAGWLAQQRNVPRRLCELAHFEWLQGESFDAAEAPRLSIDTLSVLPADAWPTLRLQRHPAARLLTMTSNAADVAQAHASDAPLPVLSDAATSHLLLWRHQGEVCWRRLEADEADALNAIKTGESFAWLCEQLNDPPGNGALRAVSLLKRWLTDGLLIAP